MSPGVNNPTTVTTDFLQTDAIEVDFVGAKATTVGPYYFELINSTTGETALSSNDRVPTSFNGQDTGTGTDLSGIAAGKYDFNLYYNNELVYQTAVTVS